MAIKDFVTATYDGAASLAECIDLLDRGFLFSNGKFTEKARATAETVIQGEAALTQGFLAETRKGDLLAHQYVSVPSHVARIAQYVGRIAEAIDKKIRDGVLFSDKATGEVHFLFENLKDVLSNTSDMLLARNEIISRYVRESETNIVKTANDFSTQHEERLIEGLCAPVASTLYLDILDSVKGIAWCALQIIQALGK